MEHRLDPKDLRRVVREELENARENGETFARWTLEQIASDMVDYSEPLEKESPEDLKPHIQEWLKEQETRP